MFNLKSELEDSDRDWLFTQLRGLATLPMVRGLVLGELLDPSDETYRPRLTTDYRWSLTCKFDSENDLYTYINHSEHQRVVQEFRRRISAVLFYDFVAS